ncbi:MAG TPA: bifunctional precorrin-2 dehydrogenase/sirohydrochlorin ferrochelatase [Chryseosolibacter sp.]|nr:bifunctional precorrin-2 dehydrogenase/sirohydrochlorin ferrochelatase [Chryseosolibacter sp.]
MNDRNNLFPVFLKLEELDTLIVGGGNVALEKVQALLKSSPMATITLVAPEIRNEIRQLSVGNRRLHLVERNFRVRDLQRKDLVILATDNHSLHIRIRTLARKKRVLINVADTPELCDFYLGSIVTKGHIKIGISTNGKSPTIAKRLREYFEEILPDDTSDLLDKMQKIRKTIKGEFREKVRALNEITSGWLERSKTE